MPATRGANRGPLPTRNHLYLLSVVILLESVRRLGSHRLAALAARALAGLAYGLSRTKRARMQQNLAHIFGESLAPAEADAILRGAFHTFWDETLSFVPWRGAREPRLEIAGVEHLQAALAEGKGAILWESGFFGRRNIAKQALRQYGFRIHQVHDERHLAGFARDDDRGWVRDRIVIPYLARREHEFTEGVIFVSPGDSLAFTRTLLATLRRNGILCITADVASGHRFVPLPILGAPKPFATGMVTLSRTCGAPLLPLFCVEDRDRRLRVVIEPAIPVPEEGSRESLVERPLRRYVTLLENYIRRYPEQYRNWHFPWWQAK